MPKKKSRKSVLITTISIAITLFIVGFIAIMMFLSSLSENFIEATNEGSTIRAKFYDVHGNKISGVSQRTIGTTPGVFYIGFDLLVENDVVGGSDVDFESVDETETHPADLTTSLAGESLHLDQLLLTDGQVEIGTSTNSCIDNTNCASNEICLLTQCLIDISNFPLGITNFGFTAEGNFLDAIGNPQSVDTGSVNLPLDFQEDGIVLRFEKSKLGALSTFTNSWIVADANLDGVLETYGGDGIISIGSDGGDFNGICVLSGEPDFIEFYGNYVIQKSPINTNKIYLCEDKTIDNWIVFHKNDVSRCDSSHVDYPGCQSTISQEPWFSSLCSVALPPLPCQEVYIISIAPPPESCIDGIKNQDETDVDCGGLICSACTDDLMCILDSDCLSNHCVLVCEPALSPSARTQRPQSTIDSGLWTSSSGSELNLDVDEIDSNPDDGNYISTLTQGDVIIFQMNSIELLAQDVPSVHFRVGAFNSGQKREKLTVALYDGNILLGTDITRNLPRNTFGEVGAVVGTPIPQDISNIRLHVWASDLQAGEEIRIEKIWITYPT